jgi:hypothetical protein
MVAVLRVLRGANMLEANRNLYSYVERAEARPAFKRALIASSNLSRTA